MEIASIKGDTVLLLYHPTEAAADVGQQFSILELPDKKEGLITQVISNDSLEYVGLQQEMIQRILEQRISQIETPLNRERGMGEIKSLKVATAKIRKRVREGQWEAWDGWIPTRNAEISQIKAEDLLKNILPNPKFCLQSFAAFNSTPIQFDGPRFNMVNVVTGVKGSGKSHLAKHLVLSLAEREVPCIIFDINGEYVELPNAQVLRWGGNFMPDLAEVGYRMLETVIQAVYSLPETSRNVLNARLPQIFAQRRTYQAQRNQAFSIDINDLRRATWSTQDFVAEAIDRRLEIIDGMNLFASSTQSGAQDIQTYSKFDKLYEQACAKRPIVFDLREREPELQAALVKAMNEILERICASETSKGQGRYPFVFFEEAHFYISETAILNLITRGRHIGMASMFITNTPQKLPDTVFRQLDNLFLLGLTHKDDIKNVSKNSFTDEDTIQSLATRMPERHALIIGNVTDRYPLVVKVDPLPEGIPPTGRTRSTWDRFSIVEQDFSVASSKE
jgi:hypothetical protein